MALNGNNDELNGYNTVLKTGESNNVNHVKAIIPPIGAIIAWAKTFTTADSGTATTDTTGKLVDSGATFLTTGILAGMIVHNTTDDVFGIVSSVDSESTITLAADSGSGSAVTDVFPDGNENYVIYATPALPDGWLELNGQTISDSDSPYNGSTLPDMNDSTQRFLRGATASGGTGGADSHTHTVTPATHSPLMGGGPARTTGEDSQVTTSSASNIPAYYQAVFIMRIK